jgi:hypothetical protein
MEQQWGRGRIPSRQNIGPMGYCKRKHGTRMAYKEKKMISLGFETGHKSLETRRTLIELTWS